MATTFSGDVGYRGVVKLDNVILLATSGSINLAHNPIFSAGVWGAGYQNASEQVAYADNYLQLDGSFACEMTPAAFDAVKKFAFTNRGAADGTPIAILPNGESGFTGSGWCTSLSFSAAQDAVLTADMNFASYIDEQKNKITTGVSDNSALGASEGSPAVAYNALYPYWATEIYTAATPDVGSQLADIMNWSASYSSSVEFLKTCGRGTGFQDDNESFPAPLAADYIVLGAMTAEGSYTVFKLQGDFDPNAYHKQKTLLFEVKSPATGKSASHKILLPKIVNTQGSTSIQSGSSFITADFSFTALGDGKNPPLALDPVTDTPES